MPKAHQLPAGWDAIVEQYDRFLVPFFACFAADALRLVGVRPGQRVLDVAAGPGTLALPAARLGATVVAVDFAPGMVARLRRNARAAGLVDLVAEVMDGQALALPAGAFDAAFSLFGLIFFPDRAAGFRELRRILRPGGTAAVAAWSTRGVGSGPFLARAVRQVLPAAPAPATPRAAASLADPEAFAREMRAAGFARVAIQTVAHSWEAPSAEAVWDALHTNPAIVAQFTERQRAAIGALFIDGLRAQFGAGPVRLEGEAHIGVGTT